MVISLQGDLRYIFKWVVFCIYCQGLGTGRGWYSYRTQPWFFSYVAMFHFSGQSQLEKTKNLQLGKELGKTHPLVGHHLFWSNYSDLTRPHPKWWFSKGNPLISGKSRLVKYYNLARIFLDLPHHLW